jgi:hypothetical protein
MVMALKEEVVSASRKKSWELRSVLFISASATDN